MNRNLTYQNCFQINTYLKKKQPYLTKSVCIKSIVFIVNIEKTENCVMENEFLKDLKFETFLCSYKWRGKGSLCWVYINGAVIQGTDPKMVSCMQLYWKMLSWYTPLRKWK